MMSAQSMIAKRTNADVNTVQKRVLGKAETRDVLETLWGKSFDPESLEKLSLDRIEAARFIAERARLLRHVALKSEQAALIWMVENVYYEAYAQGCSKQPEMTEPPTSSRLSS
jgi:hypothetical protein